MQDEVTSLLKASIQLQGRSVFSQNDLKDIIGKGRSGAKQIRAYNMCDGANTQSDVVKALKLDSGNFSRTLSRWISAGIVFRLTDGKDAKLLHVYPLTEGK